MNFTHAFIIFISFFIGLFCYDPKPIIEISKHVLPKTLGKVLLIVLAIITFIFGIHSETFLSYDKHITNLNNQYNWFSPIDIIRFPVDQYRINTRDVYPENIIDFSEGLINNFPKRKITILLDKTGSIANNYREVENEALKNSLIKNLDTEIDGFKAILGQNKIKVQGFICSNGFRETIS